MITRRKFFGGAAAATAAAAVTTRSFARTLDRPIPEPDIKMAPATLRLYNYGTVVYTKAIELSVERVDYDRSTCFGRNAIVFIDDFVGRADDVTIEFPFMPEVHVGFGYLTEVVVHNKGDTLTIQGSSDTGLVMLSA